MEAVTPFHLLSETAGQPPAGFVLIGGFALSAYGVTRQTADVDLLTTEAGYAGIRNCMSGHGYAEIACTENFARLRCAQPGLLDIDVLFVDDDTYARITSDAGQIVLGGRRFLVPAVQSLIALKLHALRNNWPGRAARDLLDIVALVEANGLDVRSDDFTTLCRRYGNEDILSSILKFTGAGA